MNSINRIYPCFWAQHDARELAAFYTSVFPDSQIESENEMTAIISFANYKWMILNGGPAHTPNPSISISVACASKEEVDNYWSALADGGNVMMELNSYEWSPYYGWLQDKYGISWQLMLGEYANGQKLVTSLMFSDAYNGKAEDAMHFYAGIFPKSAVKSIYRHPEEQAGQAGNISHAEFELDAKLHIAFDGGTIHAFTFSCGASLVVECEDQQEIDHYWNHFAQGGEESMCGWVRDKYGIWWQVVPSILGTWMNDPQKAGKVMEAFLKMRKFDLQILKQAAES